MRLAWWALVVLAVFAGGCAGARDGGRVSVGAGGYAGAFEAAKETLRDRGFALARVDAAAGVIETRPLASAGLATPWSGVETTAGEEVEGVLQSQRRAAVVRFAPEGAGAPEDLRSWDGAVAAEVEVKVWRLQRRGRKVESASIRRSGYWDDPASPHLEENWKFFREDDGLASALAADLASRLAARGEAPSVTPVRGETAAPPGGGSEPQMQRE